MIAMACHIKSEIIEMKEENKKHLVMLYVNVLRCLDQGMWLGDQVHYCPKKIITNLIYHTDCIWIVNMFSHWCFLYCVIYCCIVSKTVIHCIMCRCAEYLRLHCWVSIKLQLFWFSVVDAHKGFYNSRYLKPVRLGWRVMNYAFHY